MHLEQAFADGLDEVLFQLLDRIALGEEVLRVHVAQHGEGQVRIDRAGTVAGEQGKMLHFARLARLDDQAAMRASLFANQMVMHAAGGQQRGNRHPLRVHAAVGQDQQRDAVGNGGRSLGPQLVHPPLAARQGRRCGGTGSTSVRLLKPGRSSALIRSRSAFVRIGWSSRSSRHCSGVFGQQVAFRANRRDQRSDDFFANRVQGRVGHLGEQLLEIVVQQLRIVREHGQRRVVAHRTERLRSRRPPWGPSARADLPACSRRPARVAAAADPGGR